MRVYRSFGTVPSDQWSQSFVIPRPYIQCVPFSTGNGAVSLGCWFTGSGPEHSWEAIALPCGGRTCVLSAGFGHQVFPGDLGITRVLRQHPPGQRLDPTCPVHWERPDRWWFG